MASTTSRKNFFWLSTFLTPRKELKRVLNEGAGNLPFFFMILSGFMLLQLNFDFKNRSDDFATGQLMSFSLIFGPFLGLLFGGLTSLFLVNTGCLLDPTHVNKYEYRQFDPSYLFWLMLFIPKWLITIPLALGLFLVFRYFELWNRSSLHSVRYYYSKALSRISYFFGFVGKGRTNYSKVWTGVGAAMIIFFLLTILSIYELRVLEGANFSSAYDTFSGPAPFFAGILIPLLKAGLILWFIYSLALLQTHAFRLKLSRAFFSSVISVGTAFVIIYFLSDIILKKALSED